MVKAKKESREQERLRPTPDLGGLDLSQEGRVSLPTTRVALFRLGLAYNERALAICESALAAAGGRGSTAAVNKRLVPSLSIEARARGALGSPLHGMGEQRQRSLDLAQQAVAQLRQVLQTAPAEGNSECITDGKLLAGQLCYLGGMQADLVGRGGPGSDGQAEAEACMREALELNEADVGTIDLNLQEVALTRLANMTKQYDQSLPLRAQLNELLVQTERSPDTSCAIWYALAPSCIIRSLPSGKPSRSSLDPLEQAGGGAGGDGTGDGGRLAGGDTGAPVPLASARLEPLQVDPLDPPPSSSGLKHLSRERWLKRSFE